MSEVELYLIEEGENCTVYTLQFLRDSETELKQIIFLTYEKDSQIS
jgi:hypothetical protein